VSEKQVRWLVRISKINAWTVAVTAGVFGLVSLVTGSLAGVVVGAGVSASGFIEMRGHRRLAAGQAGARQWMAGSQVWLVTCVLAYCGWRLAIFDSGHPLALLGDETMVLQAAGMVGMTGAELGDLVTKIYRWTYGSVAGLTVLFQGGLGLYYWSRIGRLEANSPPPQSEPSP